MTQRFKIHLMNVMIFLLLLCLIGIFTLGGYLAGLTQGKTEQLYYLNTLVNERDFWEWKYGREKEDHAETRGRLQPKKKGLPVRVPGYRNGVSVGPPNPTDSAGSK